MCLGLAGLQPQTVSPEYALKGMRVDYALCHPPNIPRVFVEVKKHGQGDGAERQLFQYVFHEGVQLAILTDGQAWNFFLPAEHGDYEERCVYKLDIVERDIDECVRTLRRYLEYDAIVSGEAINSAREDYKNLDRERQIQTILPLAWRRLVEDGDEDVLESLANRVETLSGYKPAPDTVASFLKTTLGGPTSPIPASRPRLPAIALPLAPTAIGFILDGEHHPARSARDVLIKIFETLTTRDDLFPGRFAALPEHGRTRRYLARDPAELYPGQPQLMRYSRQLSSGWWLDLNQSKDGIRKIIKMACEVARLRSGEDLKAELGD